MRASPRSAAVGSFVIMRLGPAICPNLEQNRRECADLLEATTLVDAAGRGVVVVDIQADRWCDAAQCVAHDGGDAGGGQAPAPELGGRPDALDLRRVPGDDGQL